MQITEVKCAFKNRVYCGNIININNVIDPVEFLTICCHILTLKIGEFCTNYQSATKINFELACDYVIKKGQTETITTIYFATKMTPLTSSQNFKDWYMEHVVQYILNKMDEFQDRECGKVLKNLLHLQMNINKFQPTNERSSYIQLPNSIGCRYACVNVKNDDVKCFIWSLLSALFPVNKHPQLTSNYPQNPNEIFNLSGINFPTPLFDIPKFEKHNDISINVYGLEPRKLNPDLCDVVRPLLFTKQKKKRHVNLLYLKDGDCSHYCWIKNLPRLLRPQFSKHNSKTWVCDRCHQYFGTKTLLTRHDEDCKHFDVIKIDLPNNKNKWLFFKNFARKERHPFVVYADFESLTKPIDTCQPDPTTSYTNAYQNHIPCAIGYQVVCEYDSSLSFYDSYLGPNASNWFMERMKNVARKVEQIFDNIIPMKMTDEDKQNFIDATDCHICKKPLNNDKIRDHCHLTGKFRGAAHNGCNINYNIPPFVPVFFHNFSGYDSHIFVKELGTDEMQINLIPINEESFISFSKMVGKIELRFLDSFRFMSSSLEKLASYVDRNALRLMKKFQTDSTKLDLLTRKGVFPYDYMTDWDKLNETNLPPKTAFYSKLREANISENDYSHAQKVWDLFQIKDLGEYTELYLKTDVLLLADVFENFRDVCLKSYELDPVHYYTTAGLTWDAMLKITRQRLELLTDPDMVLLFERGIRGGISQVCNHYSKANNHYMTNYDPTKPETFLMYFDACNLYEWAMSQVLPVGGFRWLTEGEICRLDINSIPQDGSDGYVFEVDLTYERNLHDKHKDLPFCCEHRAPPGSKFNKLMTTLHDKKKYVIHYRNLQQCLAEGLKLTKIYRVVKFRQAAWLEKYIGININMRKAAKNEFELFFFKLMNNAVIGKSTENIRKRREIKLVSKWDGRGGARELIAKPNFSKISILTESLVAIELHKIRIYYNKPIYLGMAILDLGKLLMYDFSYNYLIPTFEHLKLMYMDTDSFIYEITGHDVYEQMKIDIHKFDTSNYPLDNRYGIPQANKKVIGLMKDGNAGLLITEFVGLRAKVYSLTAENVENNYSKAKGISGKVTKTLTIDDYKKALFQNSKLYKIQKNIISIKHDIFTVEQNKLALSAEDDKRQLIPNSTDTLPWGYGEEDENDITTE